MNLTFLPTFGEPLKKMARFTWTVSDNEISILYYFNDENINLQNILKLLNSFASSFGLDQRGWQLPFTMQTSDLETWSRNCYKRVEFVVRC